MGAILNVGWDGDGKMTGDVPVGTKNQEETGLIHKFQRSLRGKLNFFLPMSHVKMTPVFRQKRKKARDWVTAGRH